ncbi:hypothetical protein BUALT_Bualt15G0060800 [Buddleja alternifolia]|uniref:HVA22-like protein n=1 Tax=Buddleja alternifolia TaxID=168488 RepID=A0AAV6WIA4_9LAMI|nr:hypothetical protein BUALT_Bualt15G0060800 [Buddleja alternifolia]
MVLMGLLKFALLCIDSLAWPVFAVIYPVCASIRAIENNSKKQLRKLVIYWTFFSLISLFELAFVKTIQWIPYWPNIKLITTLLLVVPRFNGASHAYQCLILPFLSMNLDLQPFTDDKPKEEKPLMIETLAEPIITSKWTEPDDHQKDGEIVAAIENSAKGVKEIELLEATGENRPPETTVPLKKVQQEWICVLCNVKTTCEQNLNAHFRGNRHRDNFIKTSIPHIKESQQRPRGQQKQQAKLKQDCNATKPFKLFCGVCDAKLLSELDMANHIKGKRHSSNIEKLMSELGSGKPLST